MKIKSGPLIVAALGVLMAAAAACTSSTPASPAPGDPDPTVTSPAIQEPIHREVPAPIESVSLDRVAAKPPNSTLVVVSGLPNGCFEFSRYVNLSLDGDTIGVDVLNRKDSEIGQGCAEIYRTVTTNILLPAEVGACRSYMVIVNGASHAVRAIDPAVRCMPPDVPDARGAGPQGDTVKVLAPIDRVYVAIVGSIPPQYFLNVRSGLPNGCARFGGYEMKREGSTILVEITNLAPADADVACTEIYGTVETRLGLGTDFERSRTYTVHVNDVTDSFVGVLAPTGRPSPTLGRSFSLELGAVATLAGTEGVEVEFIEVLEDSRCLTYVVCVWAGRATLAVSLKAPGEVRQVLELTLGDTAGGRSDKGTFGEFVVQLLQLNPYPGTISGGASPPLTVWLVVSESGS